MNKTEFVNIYAEKTGMDAFALYEIATHGVDPRKTLEGTLMRTKKDEGYKIDI